MINFQKNLECFKIEMKLFPGKNNLLFKSVVLVFINKFYFIVASILLSVLLSFMIFCCYDFFPDRDLERFIFNEIFNLLFFEILYPLLCLLITFLAYVCIILLLFGRQLAVYMYLLGAFLIILGFSINSMGRSLMLIIPSAVIILVFGLKILMSNDR